MNIYGSDKSIQGVYTVGVHVVVLKKEHQQGRDRVYVEELDRLGLKVRKEEVLEKKGKVD